MKDEDKVNAEEIVGGLVFLIALGLVIYFFGGGLINILNVLMSN